MNICKLGDELVIEDLNIKSRDSSVGSVSDWRSECHVFVPAFSYHVFRALWATITFRVVRSCVSSYEETTSNGRSLIGKPHRGASILSIPSTVFPWVYGACPFFISFSLERHHNFAWWCLTRERPWNYNWWQKPKS